MKIRAINWDLLLLIIFILLSCSKENPIPSPVQTRTIRFELYTKKDFSDNNKKITFSLFIRNQNKVLFDSTISVMKIKDIPDSNHKLVLEKKVACDNILVLAAGFHYAIEGVGSSSHLDTCKVGELFKVIDFSFQ